jgi:hypothetical protein
MFTPPVLSPSGDFTPDKEYTENSIWTRVLLRRTHRLHGYQSPTQPTVFAELIKRPATDRSKSPPILGGVPMQGHRDQCEGFLRDKINELIFFPGNPSHKPLKRPFSVSSALSESSVRYPSNPLPREIRCRRPFHWGVNPV